MAGSPKVICYRGVGVSRAAPATPHGSYRHLGNMSVGRAGSLAPKPGWFQEDILGFPNRAGGRPRPPRLDRHVAGRARTGTRQSTS
eukprot:3757328-Heterocapsa_arctica.AAC.1